MRRSRRPAGHPRHDELASRYSRRRPSAAARASCRRAARRRGSTQPDRHALAAHAGRRRSTRDRELEAAGRAAGRTSVGGSSAFVVGRFADARGVSAAAAVSFSVMTPGSPCAGRGASIVRALRPAAAAAVGSGLRLHAPAASPARRTAAHVERLPERVAAARRQSRTPPRREVGRAVPCRSLSAGHREARRTRASPSRRHRRDPRARRHTRSGASGGPSSRTRRRERPAHEHAAAATPAATRSVGPLRHRMYRDRSSFLTMSASIRST